MEFTQLLPRNPTWTSIISSSGHPSPGHWSLWNRCIRGHCAPVDRCVTPPSQSRHMPCPDSREYPGLDIDPVEYFLQIWQTVISRSPFFCCYVVYVVSLFQTNRFSCGFLGISKLWEMPILEWRLHRSIFHANLQISSKLHTQHLKVCLWPPCAPPKQ